MKPTQFDYHRPSTLEEVFDLLETHPDAELMAGNQSLGIVMANRLATPEHLIDLGAVDELEYVREEDDAVRIGSMVTHRAIERSELLAETVPMLPRSAEQIAGPSVRSRGTLGGSLAEADPAGNYPTALLALDATIHLRSASEDRSVSAEEFYIAYMFTELREEEVIESVTVPLDLFPPDVSGMAFEELKPAAQTWPTISAAAAVRVDDPGADEPIIEAVRLVLANAADVPLRVEDAESELEGEPLSEAGLDAAADIVVEAVDPTGEMHADRDYKVETAGEYAKRSLEIAYGNAVE
ncbi:FAD binding domain-containing protein [Natrinema longum]|uniref:FAD binding domain-containing protein n=1 Tax=Natrinema longum TaxID=370324 RepID=UPI001CCC91E5|nr:FAD binding domain-containing protein [Natrinema longum]MBZ6497081.1 FAD binding domain-containing protein [Natrinema longum]